MQRLSSLGKKAVLKPLFVNCLTLYFHERKNSVSEIKIISWLLELTFLSFGEIPYNWTVPAQEGCILFSLSGKVLRPLLLLKHYVECKATEVMEHELRACLYSNSNPENMFHCVRAWAHQPPKFAIFIPRSSPSSCSEWRHRVSPGKDTPHTETCCMWITTFPSILQLPLHPPSCLIYP